MQVRRASWRQGAVQDERGLDSLWRVVLLYGIVKKLRLPGLCHIRRCNKAILSGGLSTKLPGRQASGFTSELVKREVSLRHC